MKRLGLIAVFTSCFALTGCIDVLPKCDSKDTKDLLSQIINDAGKSDGVKFISAKNITEDGFNKQAEIRVCSADIMVSDGSEMRLTYNITWQNKKKGYFYVQLVNAEE